MRIGRSAPDFEKESVGSSDLPRFGRRLEDDVLERLVSFLQSLYGSRQDSNEKRSQETHSSSLPKFGRQVVENMEVPKFGRELPNNTEKDYNDLEESNILTGKIQRIDILPLLRYDEVSNLEETRSESQLQPKRGVSMLRFGRSNPTDDDVQGEDSEVKRQNPLLRFGKRQSPLVRFGKRNTSKDLDPFSSTPKRQAANILRFG